MSIEAPFHEGTGSFSNGNFEIEVKIRLSTEDTPSASQTLTAAGQALQAALVACGYYAVEQTLGSWHEQRAAESRSGKEF